MLRKQNNMDNPTIIQGKGKYKLVNEGRHNETKIWLNCVKCGDWCSKKQYHFCVKCHRDWQRNTYK